MQTLLAAERGAGFKAAIAFAPAAMSWGDGKGKINARMEAAVRNRRAALRDMNAQKVLALLDRVAGLFGPKVPQTLEERNQIIDSWPDDDARGALLSSIDDELMPLVRALDDELESFVVQRGLASRV